MHSVLLKSKEPTDPRDMLLYLLAGIVMLSKLSDPGFYS